MASENDIVIEYAGVSDVDSIISLLAPNVTKQSVLPRKHDEIVAALAFFRVARRCVDRQVVGCVSLKDYGDGLFEIRSLVVDSSAAGCGIGTRLLTTLLEDARALKAKQVFTLTIRPNLFTRLGFTVVPKESFPQKIWGDCALCPKKDTCDETALTMIP